MDQPIIVDDTGPLAIVEEVEGGALAIVKISDDSAQGARYANAASASATSAAASASTATTQAAAAAASASQALQTATAAQGTVHTLTTAVSAGGSLPFEVSALSGSFVGTGTGGTPGEYALVVTGGPAGHTAFITVGSDGKIASARIGARGIATANTAPTYALPSGTGLTGATLPTPTVTAIQAGRIFLAPNANSGATFLLGWTASGGAIASWNVGGVQWADYNKAGIDAAFATKATAEVFEFIAVGTDNTNPPLYLDSDGRVLRRVTDPGVLSSVNTLLSLVGSGPIVLEIYEFIQGSLTQSPLALDSAGRVVLWSSDTTTLSNNVAALTTRVAKRSDANGMPLYTPIYAAHRLRRTNMKLRQLTAPFSVAGVQLGMLFQGNSYIDTNAYFIQNLLRGLRTKYGSAGPGYASFGSPNILDPGLFLTRSGTWTIVDESVPTLDLYLAQSSTPGSNLQLQSFSGGQPVNSARLFWTGTADGVIQYRFNGGSWTTLNVQGSGFQSAVLSGISTGSNAWTMDFQVVSGTVQLHGVLLKNSNAGILMHKAGNNGSTTLQRATLNAAQQQAAIAAAAPDIGVIINATNDKGAGQTAAQFATSTIAMINNLRTAVPVSGGVPAIDILLCIENNIPPRPSNRNDDYMTAILNIADQYDCAVLSMIDVFGQDPSSFSAWTDTYNTPASYHPDGATGGYLWIDQLMKIFNA